MKIKKILPISLVLIILLSVAYIMLQPRNATPKIEPITSTFKLQNLNCTNCEKEIGLHLKKLDGIKKVRFDKKTYVLSVTYMPDKLSPYVIKNSLNDAGIEFVNNKNKTLEVLDYQINYR